MSVGTYIMYVSINLQHAVGLQDTEEGPQQLVGQEEGLISY